MAIVNRCEGCSENALVYDSLPTPSRMVIFQRLLCIFHRFFCTTPRLQRIHRINTNAAMISNIKSPFMSRMIKIRQHSPLSNPWAHDDKNPWTPWPSVFLLRDRLCCSFFNLSYAAGMIMQIMREEHPYEVVSERLECAAVARTLWSVGVFGGK